MRIRASTIIKACHDPEYEKRLSARLAREGYPELDVVWDVPQTKENLQLVDEFLLDADPRFNARVRLLRTLTKAFKKEVSK